MGRSGDGGRSRGRAPHSRRPTSVDRTQDSIRAPHDGPRREARAQSQPARRSANTRRIPRPGILIAAAAVIVLVILLVALPGEPSEATAHKASKAEVTAGVDYITQLEDTDASDVESKISDIRHQKGLESIQSGALSKVWSMFRDYAVLGDSRAVGFYTYNFLDRTRVLAEGGSTISDVADHYDELRALNPTEVFLCYGLNDISIGYWNTPAEYTASLGDVVKGIKEVCPRATVYVSSTLVARDPAFERSDKWRLIPEWNVAIKTYCEQNSIPYVDNESICNEYASLWSDDGIHVSADFYPLWASNMMSEVLKHEQA